jgi:nitronate monooxygenase
VFAVVDLRDRLRLEHPLAQAGMGGGLAGAELAGAVSRAGALGTVGLVASPETLRKQILRARGLAPGRPVAANLLLPFADVAHAQACIDAGAACVTLFCGWRPDLVARLRAAGVLVLHQVGTSDQARHALADGADGLIAQGIEAGGHLLGVEPALRFLARALELAGGRPVLLAGGIADRGDVSRALEAGASAAVAGTRFLLTAECAAHPTYKRRVLGAPRTLETLLFSVGWYDRHRVVPNEATRRWCRRDPLGPRVVRHANERSASLLRRLPPRAQAISLRAQLRLQTPRVPLYGPAAMLEGMDERLIEVTPLYAGESAARIASVIPAAAAVAELVGIAPVADGAARLPGDSVAAGEAR